MAKVPNMHFREAFEESSNVNKTKRDPSRLLDTVRRFVRLARTAQDQKAQPTSEMNVRWEQPVENRPSRETNER